MCYFLPVRFLQTRRLIFMIALFIIFFSFIKLVFLVYTCTNLVNVPS
jgi:hypothetical protein